MAFKQSEVEKLLADTGRRCCLCGTLHTVQVHHMVPKEGGGSDDIGNGIPLCPNCHDEVHGRYTHGRTTRSYSPSELTLHRERTIQLVRKEAQWAPGTPPWNEDPRAPVPRFRELILSFSALFQGILTPLQGILTPRARPIHGHWDTSYSYIDDSGRRIDRTDTIRLKQLGAYLHGHNEGPTIQVDGGPVRSGVDRYKISGRLRHQGVFTGTWKSTCPKETYHGSFQLIVSHDGKTMWGRWLGFDHPDKVNWGDWKWSLRK